MLVLENTYSGFEEALAYETLWAGKGITQKRLAEKFGDKTLPSEILKIENGLFPDDLRGEVQKLLEAKAGKFNVLVNGSFQYPERFRDAKYPLELFYYKGDIGLLKSPAVSVVGSRECTEDGRKRARKISRELVARGYTVVAGLAKGIDTEAHTAAMEAGGNTIGVIGTPIDEYYPKENKGLQDTIGKRHLLISQVPFYRYATEHFLQHKNHFPERNATMSAISEATIIVEASDTSGTLTQARACLHQGRKLFILRSCLNRAGLKWPHTYLEKGAIPVDGMDDIFKNI